MSKKKVIWMNCVVVYVTDSLHVEEFNSHEEADEFIDEQSEETGGQFVRITSGSKDNPPSYRIEEWL